MFNLLLICNMASFPPPTCHIFTASWHPSHTSVISHILPLLEQTFPAITFAPVETDTDASAPELAEKLGVTVVPTFALVAQGQTFGLVEDDDIAAITNKCRELVEALDGTTTTSSSTPTSTSTTTSTTTPLNSRIEKLLSTSFQSPLVFIKGTPESPRCGFSRQICELLSSNNISFDTFDIMLDENQDVRQGLKTYSDWPTYPQLYFKGELLGGLDIVKEMAEGGDLRSELGLKEGESEDDSLNSRLTKLVKRSKVMLFMKGVPSAPRCGFSKQIVAILDEMEVDYDGFNILEDEEVRQGLKEFSDWPTFPQLYSNGELLGGLDIIKEMRDSGELEQELK